MPYEPTMLMPKIDKMPQNSKCRLYDDNDETINHIINESSKLAQNSTRLDMNGWRI